MGKSSNIYDTVFIRVSVITFILVLCDSTTVAPEQLETEVKCERAPLHAQPADANYRLGIAGDPDLFLPGELYTVSLQGVNSGQGPNPFIGFTIWAQFEEEVKANDNRNDNTQVPTNNSVTQSHLLGAFQAKDAQTKLNQNCTPAVGNVTSHPKTDIQVIWSAPLNATDRCILLCAKAVPSSAQGVPTVLARKMCAAPSASVSLPRQPPIIEPCCACDEAKYEVTFEGLWSRNTHPREFPPQSAFAHFGDIIGASHTAQYRVWQEGRVASPGLRRLADDGATTALEKELKAESEHIRTIIKARGISWQQVAGTGIPSTFAVFRVDAKNHLMSLAAKLAPSPDWIVGVSALELCNANCTWRRSATLPLFPYDAGTDNGLSYTSIRQPTTPLAPVRALRPDWPRDVRSPFFSTMGEMRPFARLRLSRLRLYEKNCDSSRNEEPGMSSETRGTACATHAWAPWGPCSVTCGVGRTTRQRHYVWPARAYTEACRASLTDRRTCHGPRLHCRAPTEYEPDPAESSGPCGVSAWSEWSACEGCGVRARTRHYLRPRAQKHCHVGYRARTVMSQAMPCEAGPCQKPMGAYANATNFDWFYVDKPQGPCSVSVWGSWGPCSAECGRGKRIRTRLYLAKDANVQQLLTNLLMQQWNARFAQMQGLEMPEVNRTGEDPELMKLVENHLEGCQSTLSMQEALCDGESLACLQNGSKEICKLPSSVGHCRSYEERWFFDSSSNTCEPFGFTGCGGNANNFKTREVCLNICQTNETATTTNPPKAETVTKKMKPTISSSDNDVMQNDSPLLQVDINCEVGPWLGWSACFGECRHAMKLNYRLIMGVNSGQGPNPFIGFTIWAQFEEEVKANDNRNDNTQVPTNNSVTQSHLLGAFQAKDAQTKLNQNCTPAVGNVTSHPKTDIQVIWSAPLNATDRCILLCAKAVPSSAQGVPTVLARKMCAAPSASVSLPRQPPIIEPCCACDEAKYEVTFEGLWSRNTHPREFPPQSAFAHFGDIIGASHTAQYRVWQEGRVASPGLRRLADDGATTALEKELKAESEHIRTIIKARGISWQQVAGTGIPSTFAVFRVDAKNHLMSLAAKLAPSPDWIVGVSALELCNANCTWRRSATLPLFPYDAGTDNGLSYTSIRQPTTPLAPVRALRPDWPRDVRSPFFSTMGEMRPFARLRLSRLRLYEKNCDSSRNEEPGMSSETRGTACATHAWAPWGPCSVTCGVGRTTRQRHYVWPARAYTEACRASLTDRRTCHGPRLHCRAPTEYEPDPAESSGPCGVSAWSEWSACEGCGVRARTRHYLRPRAQKHCHVGYRARTVMSQAMPCEAGPCQKPMGAYANATNFDWFYVDKPQGPCSVSVWGSWGPCSAECGRGKRIRTRLYLAKDANVQQLLTNLLMQQWNARFAQMQGLEMPEVNRTGEDPELMKLVENHLEGCQSTLSMQEALCDGESLACLQNGSKEICKLPSSVGHCRSYEERWFFDSSSNTCEPFGFTGCGGNANNFKTREVCLNICQTNETATTTNPPKAETVTKKMKPTISSSDNDVMQNDSPLLQVDINCEVGPWLGWSACFGECRHAMKLNYRLIMRSNSGLGKPCPVLMKSKTCRPKYCHRIFAMNKHNNTEAYE